MTLTPVESEFVGPTIKEVRVPSRFFAAAGNNRKALPGLLGIVIFGLLWESVVRLRLVNPAVVPTLGDTLGELAEMLRETDFWEALGTTLSASTVSLVVSVVLAVALGLALAESAWLNRLLGATLDAIRPVPPIVLLPIAVLVLGGGFGFRLVLVLQGVLWSLLIQIVYGLRSMDPVLADVSRSFHVDAGRRLFLFRIPAALPVILTGVRLAATTAFGVSIMTELVGGEPGLGAILATAQSGNNVKRVYAVTIVTGLIGLFIAFAFKRLQVRLLPWQKVSK